MGNQKKDNNKKRIESIDKEAKTFENESENYYKEP